MPIQSSNIYKLISFLLRTITSLLSQIFYLLQDSIPSLICRNFGFTTFVTFDLSGISVSQHILIPHDVRDKRQASRVVHNCRRWNNSSLPYHDWFFPSSTRTP
jgi:hypothetical protein